MAKWSVIKLELKVIHLLCRRERQVNALKAEFLILRACISCAVSASLTDLVRAKSQTFCWSSLQPNPDFQWGWLSLSGKINELQ